MVCGRGGLGEMGVEFGWLLGGGRGLPRPPSGLLVDMVCAGVALVVAIAPHLLPSPLRVLWGAQRLGIDRGGRALHSTNARPGGGWVSWNGRLGESVVQFRSSSGVEDAVMELGLRQRDVSVFCSA